MISKSATSYELKDMKTAAAELSKAADKIPLLKNVLGVVYFSTLLDAGELMRELKERLEFDIIGCSARAVLDGEKGMHEFASCLTVLTSNDCGFNVFVSEPLTNKDSAQCVKDMCLKIPDIVRGSSLALLYAPFSRDRIFDGIPEAFGELTGGKPLFGGVAATDEGYLSLAAKNESVYFDRFVCCFIDGDINPVFASVSQLSPAAAKSHVVTRSEYNRVYTVDDLSFMDFIASMGINFNVAPEYEMDFLSSILLNIKFDGDFSGSAGVTRNVVSLNRDDGSGLSLSLIPQGSKISVSTYKSGDIEASAEACMDSLFMKMSKAEAGGYKYSTILCSSCMGRYLFMFPSKKLEGDIIKRRLPKSVNFAGFYTCGEICPVSAKDKGLINCAHNSTITMCAF